MKRWLFNPFLYIAGSRALIIGWAVMIATAFIGYLSRTHFDGVIDIHTGLITPLYVYFCEQLIDWACVTILFFAAGLAFSQSSIRFIDVAGTAALSRWIMIFPAVIGFALPVPAEEPQTINDIMKLVTPTTIMLGLLTVVIVIWFVALLYNAFRVSCNMKGGKATGSFIGALVIAEIIASFTIHHFFEPIHLKL